MAKKIKTLGSGSKGTVYLMRRKNGSYFARKLSNGFKHLRTERDMHLKVHDIAGVPKLLNYCPTKRGFIDYEYIDGARSLDHLLNNISIHDSFLICLRVIEILQQAHERGVVHRDVKQENILYNSETKQVFVIDWDDALDVNENNDRVKISSYGTTIINPVEVFYNRYSDFTKIDVWQVGALLLEMIIKDDAFKGDDSKPVHSDLELLDNIINCSWNRDVLKLKRRNSSDLEPLFDKVFVKESKRLSLDELRGRIVQIA